MKRTAQERICLTNQSDSDNKRETDGVCDKVILQLFNYDTEEEEFDIDFFKLSYLLIVAIRLVIGTVCRLQNIPCSLRISGIFLVHI